MNASEFFRLYTSIPENSDFYFSSLNQVEYKW
jgi:hypothetical protein